MPCNDLRSQATEKFFVNDSENFRNGDPRQTMEEGVTSVVCGGGCEDDAGGSGELFELVGVYLLIKSLKKSFESTLTDSVGIDTEK